MASRHDQELPIRLTVAFNELHERGAVAKLPDDLTGDAIPNQVLAHGAALKGRDLEKTTESGARDVVNDGVDLTERMLVRLRMVVLAAYPTPDDPRIAKFGPLGASDSPIDNLARLTAFLVPYRVAIASGEVAAVADLQPDVLAAHIATQDSVKVTKATSIARRQTESTSLKDHRKKSEVMLQRIKNHVKSHFPGQLEAFGFGIPAPAVRPRLKSVEPEPTTPTPTES